MAEIFNSGYFESDMTGAPEFLGASGQLQLSKYDVSSRVRPVVDQGNRGICVSCSMTDIVDYLHDVQGKKYKKPLDFFYEERANQDVDGMTPREAMEIAVKHGLIKSYACVRNLEYVKTAMFANGPLMIALPVYDINALNFWYPKEGMHRRGGHAVSVVGFDKDNLILKNSWSINWGRYGFVDFPVGDLKYAMEVWTILT